MLDTTFGDQYRFASNGKLGLTHCVPINNNNNNFVGALCNDFMPTSASQGGLSFIQNNYFPDYDINYLFFSRDSLYVRLKKCWSNFNFKFLIEKWKLFFSLDLDIRDCV
jgi:hypothetical protein